MRKIIITIIIMFKLISKLAFFFLINKNESDRLDLPWKKKDGRVA